jgi:hypothetical protein
MKKIVRLTESDITRIVKRVMNESPLLLGDPDYESNYRDSDEDDDDDLSDDDFMSKYRDYSPSWDVPTDKKLERMRRIRNKNRGGMGMNEALGLLGKRKYDIPKKKSIGNITGRKITDYASAKRYTMGTRISADDIMRYIDKGHDIYVYINGDKRVYLDSTSGDAYSEKDEHILNVKKGGSFGSQYDRLEDYLES